MGSDSATQQRYLSQLPQTFNLGSRWCTGVGGVGGANVAEYTDLELGSDARCAAAGLEHLAGRSGAGLNSEGMADAPSALVDAVCLRGYCQMRLVKSSSSTFGQWRLAEETNHRGFA